MAKKNEIENQILIKEPDMRNVKIKIKGITPLIVHAWSEKAKKEMLSDHMKEKKKEKIAKNPDAEFATSLYWIDGIPDIPYEEWTEELFVMYAKNARFGFPVTGIKQCANSAAYRLGMVSNQAALRAAYFINGIGSYQLGVIDSPKLPEKSEDMVRIGMGKADIRYRGKFNDWSMILNISYNNDGNLPLEQIINLINLGGQTNGIGEWRPERDGIYGRFIVDRDFNPIVDVKG